MAAFNLATTTAWPQNNLRVQYGNGAGASCAPPAHPHVPPPAQHMHAGGTVADHMSTAHVPSLYGVWHPDDPNRTILWMTSENAKQFFKKQVRATCPFCRSNASTTFRYLNNVKHYQKPGDLQPRYACKPCRRMFQLFRKDDAGDNTPHISLPWVNVDDDDEGAHKRKKNKIRATNTHRSQYLPIPPEHESFDNTGSLSSSSAACGPNWLKHIASEMMTPTANYSTSYTYASQQINAPPHRNQAPNYHHTNYDCMRPGASTGRGKLAFAGGPNTSFQDLPFHQSIGAALQCDNMPTSAARTFQHPLYGSLPDHAPINLYHIEAAGPDSSSPTPQHHSSPVQPLAGAILSYPSHCTIVNLGETAAPSHHQVGPQAAPYNKLGPSFSISAHNAGLHAHYDGAMRISHLDTGAGPHSYVSSRFAHTCTMPTNTDTPAYIKCMPQPSTSASPQRPFNNVQEGPLFKPISQLPPNPLVPSAEGFSLIDMSPPQATDHADLVQQHPQALNHLKGIKVQATSCSQHSVDHSRALAAAQTADDDAQDEASDMTSFAEYLDEELEEVGAEDAEIDSESCCVLGEPGAKASIEKRGGHASMDDVDASSPPGDDQSCLTTWEAKWLASGFYEVGLAAPGAQEEVEVVPLDALPPFDPSDSLFNNLEEEFLIQDDNGLLSCGLSSTHASQSLSVVPSTSCNDALVAMDNTNALAQLENTSTTAAAMANAAPHEYIHVVDAGLAPAPHPQDPAAAVLHARRQELEMLMLDSYFNMDDFNNSLQAHKMGHSCALMNPSALCDVEAFNHMHELEGAKGWTLSQPNSILIDGKLKLADDQLFCF